MWFANDSIFVALRMKSFFTGLKKSKIVEILSHNSIPQDLDRAFLRC